MPQPRRKTQSPTGSARETIASATVDHEPLHPDRIAQLAYRRYEDRGFEHGRDMDDWLDAERELRIGPTPPKE